MGRQVDNNTIGAETEKNHRHLYSEITDKCQFCGTTGGFFMGFVSKFNIKLLFQFDQWFLRQG